MKIETKYDIGQEVWLIEQNKCVSGKVLGFQYSYGKGYRYGELLTNNDSVRIIYAIESLKIPFKIVDVKEERLFPTKEELLKSL